MIQYYNLEGRPFGRTVGLPPYLLRLDLDADGRIITAHCVDAKTLQELKDITTGWRGERPMTPSWQVCWNLDDALVMDVGL